MPKGAKSASVWSKRLSPGTQSIAGRAEALGAEAVKKGGKLFSLGNLGKMFGALTLFRLAEVGIGVAEEKFIEGPKRAAGVRLQKHLKGVERQTAQEVLRQQQEIADRDFAAQERDRETNLALLGAEVKLRPPPSPVAPGGIAVPLDVTTAPAIRSAVSPAELEYYRRLDTGEPLNSLLAMGINFG